MTTRIAAGQTRPRTGGADLSWDQPEAEQSAKPPRDMKRSLLILGLGGLSWVATFVGMLELIEANVGDLPLTHKAIIGFSVAMLMVMVVWLLDQIFSDIGWLTRLLYVGGYVFLTAISVGFGFGFYWKVLESRGESSRSAETAVSQVQNSLQAGVTRLEQLQTTLDGLTQISTDKATLERQSGNTCPGSRPGDGPRRQLRDDDAGRFKFASDFVKSRMTAIRSELGSLNGDLAKVVGNDRSTIDAATGTRNEFMRSLNRRLDMTVTGFNAFRSDPQLRQIRTDLAERSDKITFPDTKGGTFQCPDSQLAGALKGVVRAIDELPSLEKPKIAAVEGSEAVIEAFRRLSATMFGALAFKMPPSAEELRDLQKKAVQSVDGSTQAQAKLNAMAAEAGLSKRDYVPLAIALFVDLCLLLVSIKRPGSALERLVPKMRAAERGPVIQILSRFNEIHRDPAIRENFEVFRHVVFDFHGDYYAAVPLNAPYRPNMRNGRQSQGFGVSDAEALLQEAHLLGNLFASFEKEKIFTRVYSPLLSTGTVQKRLRRQGSKFANSEAFRVYRFRDGAWSDIILGAVMGAARRVETAERRRRVEEEIFTERAGPAFGSAATGVTSREADGRNLADVPPEDAAARREPDWQASHPTRSFSAVPRAPFMPRVVTAVPPTGEAAAIRRAANGNTTPSANVPSESDVRRTVPPPLPDVLANAENVVLHPAVNRPTSPVPADGAENANHVGPDTDEKPVASASETVEVVPARIEPIVASAPEKTVTVAATRETVTYTLPVSEARLPASLAGWRDEAIEAMAPEAADAAGTAPIVSPPALPPPLKPAAAMRGAAGPAIEPSGDDVRNLALRFGPAPREG
ncbi:MAG: hypothetical protein JSS20_12150 [Proteobacteria bacterium]|nr:hypothetical protein [Pseudomonadota bacterium]